MLYTYNFSPHLQCTPHVVEVIALFVWTDVWSRFTSAGYVSFLASGKREMFSAQCFMQQVDVRKQNIIVEVVTPCPLI
jgi:hypothetical protein